VILQLADQQSKVLLNQDALLNYHTACVLFRVMEPMLPKKFINRQHSKLLYAIDQLKKLSRSDENRNNSLAYQEMLCKNLISGHVHDVYRIHENQLLGKGTYGSVYLATHRETGSQRAVKILNFDRINSYNVRKIHNEIILLTKLNHANIIKLHDVYYGNKAGKWYFIYITTIYHHNNHYYHHHHLYISFFPSFTVYIITDVCHGNELFECVKSGKKRRKHTSSFIFCSM
jgi:serine/threonine protein kinase